MSAPLEKTRSHRQFDGQLNYYTHESRTCSGPMKFTVYLPPEALGKNARKLPALYWLSGLTCTEETFMAEGGAPQAYAKKHGVILVAPDTSPRGTRIQGEDDRYDLGSGASFYVDATEPKWSKHYRMDSYVTRELREIVEESFPVDLERRGIFGHSMGGHGALALGLRNPDLYQSISAFAPICVPSKCPWGIQAFTDYLGMDRSKWAQYDANELLKSSTLKSAIRIDQGSADEYLVSELFTDEFERTVRSVGAPVTIHRQEGYDHGYYFISTFIEEQIAFHAKNLKG